MPKAPTPRTASIVPGTELPQSTRGSDLNQGDVVAAAGNISAGSDDAPGSPAAPAPTVFAAGDVVHVDGDVTATGPIDAAGHAPATPERANGAIQSVHEDAAALLGASPAQAPVATAGATAAGALAASAESKERDLRRPSRVEADESHLIVISRIPGFKRAGVVHPARATYPRDAFSAAQLKAFRDEPNLELIEVGGPAIPNGSTTTTTGRPFRNRHGRALLTDAELADRAHEAEVAREVGAADASIKGQALRDTARERLRDRGL